MCQIDLDLTENFTALFYQQARFVGGAIIVTDNTTVTISHSKFEDNKAEFGGAIFADNYSTINLTDNVLFINNFAENSGGVLYSIIGIVTINASCAFSSNKAVYGVLYLHKYTHNRNN